MFFKLQVKASNLVMANNEKWNTVTAEKVLFQKTLYRLQDSPPAIQK